MSPQKVSVIIPTYNRPVFLAQAVRSVLAQTHPVFEIIIVDDCSSPKHHTSIAAVGKLDERIRIYYFQENRGVSAARNYGLENSAGDYVLFLDDDDLIHRDMVQSCLKKFHERPDTDIVACWYGIFYDNSSPEAGPESNDKALHEKLKSDLYIQKYISYPSLEEKPFSALILMCPQVSSCLIRKKSVKGVRFPEELERGEDGFFWLTMAAAGRHFLINDDCLAYQRLHPFCSLSQSRTSHDMQKFLNSLLESGMICHKQDWMLTHLRQCVRLRSSDKLGSLYHGAKFLSYFLQPSVFKAEWQHLLRTLGVKFSRLCRLAKVRRMIITPDHDRL